MKRFLFGLIALAMTASFAVAQDDPAPKQTTETVWTATIAGIGG